MANVRIVQTMQHRWRLETQAGIVLQDDIILQSAHHAGEYANNYISSFQAWTYEVVPLKREKKDEQV